MLDPQPTLSELDRKLGPVLGKQIDGIEDLRKLMSESEEDVSEPRREKKQRAGGEAGGCAPATSTPRALWLHNALSDPVQLPVPLSRAWEEEQSTKLLRPRPLERPSFALTTPTYAAHTPSFFSSSAPPFDRRAPAGEEVRQARGQGQDQGEQLQKVKVNKNGKCAAVTYLDHTRGIERPHRCSSPDCGPCLLHPAAGLFCPGGLPRSLEPGRRRKFPLPFLLDHACVCPSHV